MTTAPRGRLLRAHRRRRVATRFDTLGRSLDAGRRLDGDRAAPVCRTYAGAPTPEPNCWIINSDFLLVSGAWQTAHLGPLRPVRLRLRVTAATGSYGWTTGTRGRSHSAANSRGTGTRARGSAGQQQKQFAAVTRVALCGRRAADFRLAVRYEHKAGERSGYACGLVTRCQARGVRGPCGLFGTLPDNRTALNGAGWCWAEI